MNRARAAYVIAAAYALLLGACANVGASAGTRTHLPAARVGTSSSQRVDWHVDVAGVLRTLVTDDAGVIVATDDQVLALSPRGATQWRVPVPDAGIAYPASGRGLVAVSGANKLVVLDRATGATRWTAPLAAESGPVTIAPEMVFAASTDGVLRAFARDGRLRWRAQVPGTISARGNLAYDDATGTLAVVGFNQRGGWFLALRSAATGADAGGLDLGAGEPPSAVVGAGPGRLLVGEGDSHELLAIDLRARRVQDALRTSGSFDPASHPVVDRDFAVVVDRGGGVTAMNLADGTLRWRADLGGPVLDARPVLTPTSVVVASFLGPLTVLARADGRPRPWFGAEPGGRGRAGIPVAAGLDGGRLVVGLRLAAPDRVVVGAAP